MSEGYYEDGKYVPWTTAHILDAADAESGPGCCDESYQKLRAIMEVAPEMLKALESLLRVFEEALVDEWSEPRECWERGSGWHGDWHEAGLDAIEAIAKARGKS